MGILSWLGLEQSGKKLLDAELNSNYDGSHIITKSKEMPTCEPKCLNFSAEEIEGLISRLEKQALEKEDYPLLVELIKGLVWLNFSIKEKSLSISRLRALFGVKTETAKRLLELVDKESEKKEEAAEKKPKKGNGHQSANSYLEAKVIYVAHQVLSKGAICPECKKGKLFNLKPGSFIHIVGNPFLDVEIYQTEKLRCSLCGKIFSASLPKGMGATTREDKTARAIVSLMKYRGGVPFYRQAQIQKLMGRPISVSQLWNMTNELTNDLLPIYAILCIKAAQGEILQNDDTKARILSIMEERKAKKAAGEEEKRRGTFTTGILSTLPQAQIALFFTGRKHAGENLNDLLMEREKGAPPPIQQCDGGNNVPKDHETKLACCLAHARRKFYELSADYTPIVLKVIGWFAQIFANDKQGPQHPEELLKYHQEKSKPIMESLKTYCNNLIEKKEIEPNSSMGKAIGYLNNQWEELTLFLREPGVPLTNNATERLIKRAVLNRKNAYFYRTENGARIGDTLMGTIETCVLNDINPWDYLIAIQEHQQKVRENPENWLPWNYKAQVESLHPP